MSKIKLLSDDLINQIAAGEIVERPSSALKEIIENSLDAGATDIEVFLQNGGKTKMVITDNGSGLSREDLLMAIKRHATSKLSGTNLFDISSYGFRGEAIPSIASVSDFSIESNSFGISVKFSEVSDIYPSPVESGTRVTVKNLFDKIPARLKFLKSDSVELSSSLAVVENFALTRETVAFSVSDENRSIISFKNDSLESRVAKIIGKEQFEKAIPFKESSDTISVSGFLFHPMDSRYSQSFQKVFINKRVVKDKIVSSSIRNAYKDLIPTGRFAIAVIFIEIDPFHVDVNISPTKSEIRFRDEAFVQKFLTSSIKKNLTKFDRVAIDFDVSRFENIKIPEPQSSFAKALDFITEKPFSQNQFSKNTSSLLRESIKQREERIHETPEKEFALSEPQREILRIIEEIDDKAKSNFFGKPIAQIFDSYILTQIEDGIIIIDQHAVHEKITQERILNQITKENKQFLIKPEMIELSPSESSMIQTYLESCISCGFDLDLIQQTLMISAIPAILNVNEAVEFIKNIASNENSSNQALAPLDFIKNKIANKACHNSIRFGRKLSQLEMQELINQMEQTNSIHQCNHHRPSFIVLKKDQLEKMFNRS